MVFIVVVSTATITEENVIESTAAKEPKILGFTFLWLFYRTRNYHLGYVSYIIWTSIDMVVLFFSAPR